MPYKTNGINTMKSFKFIAEAKFAKPDDIFYYTTEDDSYVSDSGSGIKENAYEKFLILAQGGSLKPKKEILEEIFFEPEN
ncbi:MAG TPA: hypothetical protein DEB23_02405 [Chitinophagaceae bacterium]|nr:hypothetical protein [Chitinophagaceae bacterium]